MRVRLKVKEIAATKGISQRYTNVTIETLGRIAKVLGVDASELIESVEDDS